ncbi:hypothetical protein Q7M76_05620 (plasmid) [Candidatus Liberibacter asiaticus]|uniref:hypothetical protein n=1 Tax=Liberibacter asiaticus TaxID=34021 RepID=UPI000B5BDEAC|nr:hypothetical protein [Candidatus Liberibacter asiaticus]ASK53200.1 hypothetical protein B2I23_05455 [Candidatus Liberibacter asiaticus]MBA2918020.1 hypothetical protein [Candidatus Liberibacter asiaticus]
MMIFIVIEAKVVVFDIVRIIEQYPKRAYGIVALNTHQKRIIEDQIELVRNDHPSFNRYLIQQEATYEDLFVKNLENVQGG